MTGLLEKTDAFAIPEADGGRYPHVYVYLRSLSVPADVIKGLVTDKILYQDVTHRAVFITPVGDYLEAWDTTTGAEPKGITLSKADAPGYWYYLPAGNATPVRAVYVLSSAVDAVRLYAKHRDNGMTVPAAYVSVGPADNQTSIDRLVAKFGRRVVLMTDGCQYAT